MQSDRNIFCGDVVLESARMASRDEESILDNVNLLKWLKKMHIKSITYKNYFSCIGSKIIFLSQNAMFTQMN